MSNYRDLPNMAIIAASTPLLPFDCLLMHQWLARASAVRRHQREGFLLFRVNGGNCFGVMYRLLVIVVMVMIGVVSGLHPLVGTSEWASPRRRRPVLFLFWAWQD